MIILKILAILAGVLISSVWLGVVISAGVTSGLNHYFEKRSSEEKEEAEGN